MSYQRNFTFSWAAFPMISSPPSLHQRIPLQPHANRMRSPDIDHGAENATVTTPASQDKGVLHGPNRCEVSAGKANPVNMKGVQGASKEAHGPLRTTALNQSWEFWQDLGTAEARAHSRMARCRRFDRSMPCLSSPLSRVASALLAFLQRYPSKSNQQLGSATNLPSFPLIAPSGPSTSSTLQSLRGARTS